MRRTGRRRFPLHHRLTKAQIDGLIAAGVLQMDLFEETLARSKARTASVMCCDAIRPAPRIGGLAAG